MRTVQDPGLYLAKITGNRKQTSRNGFAMWVVDYEIVAKPNANGTDWTPIPEENRPSITGWHMLEQTDKDTGKKVHCKWFLEQLVEALDWDCRMESLVNKESWWPPVVLDIQFEKKDTGLIPRVKALKSSEKSLNELSAREGEVVSPQEMKRFNEEIRLLGIKPRKKAESKKEEESVDPSPEAKDVPF